MKWYRNVGNNIVTSENGTVHKVKGVRMYEGTRTRVGRAVMQRGLLERMWCIILGGWRLNRGALGLYRPIAAAASSHSMPPHLSLVFIPLNPGAVYYIIRARNSFLRTSYSVCNPRTLTWDYRIASKCTFFSPLFALLNILY